MNKWLRGAAHNVLQITQGRTTAFLIGFFISGNAMAWTGKLTTVYIGFMATLGGLVLGHSIKEDLAEKLNGPRPLGGPDAPPDAQN
jgi:hypothetical protein